MRLPTRRITAGAVIAAFAPGCDENGDPGSPGFDADRNDRNDRNGRVDGETLTGLFAAWDVNDDRLDQEELESATP